MRKINWTQKKPDKKMILRGGVLLFLLLAVILTGIYFLRDSQEEEPTLEEIVESKLNAYQTDLVDSMDSFKTNRDVAQYLLAWGKNKGISCSIDSHDNVTFTLKASDDTWKSRKSVVFLCEYNVKSLAVDPEPIAAALTIAKNTKQHGKVKLIFSPSDGIGSSGVSALSASSFTSRAEVFCLGKSAFSKISLETGGYLKFRLSDKLHYQSTSYDKAYRVRISGLPAEKISAYMGSGVNPIKQLGSVLANFKSTSLLFELASFRGGNSADTAPDGAVMTIVISSADEAKFISKMDKALDRFYDKYAEQYPEVSYTYEEVEPPKRVLATEDAENIVSLLYTAFNGTYYKDDDGNVIALTNIGSISTKNQRLRVQVSALSCAQEYLDEMTEAYRTIAGLCDIKFSVKTSLPLYHGGTAAETLRTSFEEAFYAYSGDSKMKTDPTVEFTPCGLLTALNDQMPILYCSVTDKTKEKLAGAFITYLSTNSEDVSQ